MSGPAMGESTKLVKRRDSIMPALNNRYQEKMLSCLTVDVEDWFHILDSPAVPGIERWTFLESRIERNLEKLLLLLDEFSVKVTFFWLGWIAERNRKLVLMCRQAGHEIASHGYAHLLAYKVGPEVFKYDITRARILLEDIIGEPVRGFRAPGFSITKKSPWAFDLIEESGYQYDSSVFPASRGHGGISDSPLGIYFIETREGHLLEVPMSIIQIMGRKTSLFGGGYLRLANKLMIRWGINKLKTTGQPLIVYVHPREIDPDQPRLPLSLKRRFKSYINLKTTLPKLKWLCQNYSFCTMLDMVENYIKSFYLESKTVPVVRFEPDRSVNDQLLYLGNSVSDIDRESFRSRLQLVEESMANFLSPTTRHLRKYPLNASIENQL
jgi:polysaccharide deacetylase family protein (PEP-CTERM system associated)